MGVITNDTQAIIIENKIFAGDQSKQLERYFEIIKQEGFEDIRIIYLSLYGEEPSEQSIGLLKNEKDDLIYKKHIAFASSNLSRIVAKANGNFQNNK